MNTALIIGISDYPPAIGKLPAVAADVREVGKILGSKAGIFPGKAVAILTDGLATKSKVLSELERVFRSAAAEDTVLVYLAGHGCVLPSTCVPLATVKRLFDECRSRRVFLWLDCCHSGGVLARRVAVTAAAERQVFTRTLEVVAGHGKMIYAACTAEQLAYEDPKGHGVFTGYLLAGLRGAAAFDGEVTASSLYNFIAGRMKDQRQQPMQFGQMTGQVVFVQVPDGPAAKGSGGPAKTSKGAGSRSAIDSSGDWCLLGKDAFRTLAVHQPGNGVISVEIASKDAETDAKVSSLRPNGFGGSGQPTPFAYRNDAEVVRVTNVASRSQKSEQVWTVDLKVEKAQQGYGMGEMTFQTDGRTYSPDDLARLRAGRLLLNDPPPLEARSNVFSHGGMLEMYVRGGSVAVPAVECVVRHAILDRNDAGKATLQIARLAALVALKGSGVCEQVMELVLGPVTGRVCHVRFRGVRQRQYTNREPTVLEVEGDCPID
jgi:hypothetical protein